MDEANTISVIKKKILHIAKWYPNETDVQNGIFIKKHVLSVAGETQSSVLFFKQLDNIDGSHRIEKTKAEIDEFIVYHGKLSSIQSYRFKKKILKEVLSQVGQPDILHLHVLAADQLIFARYALKNKIPFFISEHWSGYVTNSFKSMSKVKQLIYRRVAKRAKAILPVSQFLEKGMRKSGLKGNYSVVPNIVDLPEVSSPKNKNFTFIVVADIADEIKNISGIVKAFQEIKKTELEIRLVIIGDGPDFKQIESLISKDPVQIALLGRFTNKDALQEMTKAHCLIVNSSIETFSVVCIEARAQGLQVISTNCGGPSEYADHFTNIIPVSNREALKAQMLSSLKVSKTFRRDIKEFTKQQVGSEILCLYHL